MTLTETLTGGGLSGRWLRVFSFVLLIAIWAGAAALAQSRALPDPW